MTEATEASGRNFVADAFSLHLRRARVACKACNARRVKCDAADGQPCWHCRTRRTPYELIESKQGKYTRKKQRLSRDQAVSRDTTTGQSIQPPLQEATSKRDRNVVAPRHCGGSNEDRPPDQETQVDEFDMLSAGTDGLRPITETQVDQTRRVARAHSAARSPRVSYIVEVVYRSDEGLTESLKVHYSIPASIAERPASDLGPRATWPLSLPEALVMPAREVADQLIRAFFEVIHPAYPVFDRREFTRQYLRGEASPLVLQTIYLLGFTVGSESLVHAAGYSDRATARKTHYLRAKALYDADYEGDPVKVVACLLLLGFW